ncbi:uncharacterized protein METZ01_LOCUS268955, partial [marine metagenome]
VAPDAETSNAMYQDMQFVFDTNSTQSFAKGFFFMTRMG